MNEYRNDKKYESLKIPNPWQPQENGDSYPLPQDKKNASVSQDDGLFYVIDYDASNMKGVGKFVLKPQKIDPPQRDEIRELFHSMREIARGIRSWNFDHNRFFDRRVQQENAKIFYKQGVFMKDFTDNYSESAQFSSYFPNYQMMSYEQLRTYFTWRTKVRLGEVENTSLSYAFLYIYELLANIGVESPQDGLDKLMSFWLEFREYNNSIDKYVLRWLKDYNIYYELPQSFREFVETNHLEKHYPRISNDDRNFDLLCSISKYDIRSSAFFTDDRRNLITDCFYFVSNQLKQILAEHGLCYEELIFQPSKKMPAWQPFRDALFYPWKKQADRRVVLSENEVYICKQNNWTGGKYVPPEDSKLFLGYIMKHMESVLRIAVKYKYKLTANSNMLPPAVLEKLKKAGLSLEAIVRDATMEFYREATKTVVSVDWNRLERIRQEALATQEKLIVPEQNEPFIPVSAPMDFSVSSLQEEPPITDKPSILSVQDLPPIPEQAGQAAALSEPWESLKNAFNEVELDALSVLITGAEDIKKFADRNGIMLEVLIDGINEKAMDFIGDNLLDEEFIIYDDYIEQVKELVG
jgi:lambda repressor-like predicted transcriptional regulator